MNTLLFNARHKQKGDGRPFGVTELLGAGERRRTYFASYGEARRFAIQQLPLPMAPDREWHHEAYILADLSCVGDALFYDRKSASFQSDPDIYVDNDGNSIKF